ncbi:MAG: diguanylate cyclase [Acidobacteria bacterium]|nr:MAG: diguanylate cyclase [Acidobacteriota bacterium]
MTKSFRKKDIAPGPEEPSVLRHLCDRLPGMAALLDADGLVVHANAAFAAVVGGSAGSLVGRKLIEMAHPEDAGALADCLRVAVDTRAEAAFRVTAGDGSWRNLELAAAPLVVPGDPVAVIAEARDVTERRREDAALRRSEERYALATRGADDGIWDWDLAADRIEYSPRWKAMVGAEEDQISDRPSEWFDRVHPEDLDALRADIAAHLQGESTRFHNEHRLLGRDGSHVWVLSRGAAIRDEQGQARRLTGTTTDITERKAAEQLLQHLAVHDALTGLPNRKAFLDRLFRSLRRAQRAGGYQFAILFLDLDRFKLVNDSLGHVTGDQLLISLAARLTDCLRPGDLVAHLGGDEFGLLVDHLQSPFDASHVAERVQKALTAPFKVGGQEVFASASIGVAFSASGYERPEDLLRDADTAMYRAKSLGSGRTQIFDQEMHTRALARFMLETDLRRALERREFCLRYQPVVSLRTGRIGGFEALVRWNHPERGLLLPADFLSVAEETGVVVPMTSWILKEACSQIRAWQALPGGASLSISVNLASPDVAQPEVVEAVWEALSASGLAGRHLRLEITESTIMKDLEGVIPLLLALKDLGIGIDIDDFGTGYSSLSYLHRLPTDALKVDRSFVGRSESPGEAAIVRTIVELAHSLDRQVIAEGIETAAQLSLLRSLRCEYGQGFHFSRPLTPGDAEALIVRNPSW